MSPSSSSFTTLFIISFFLFIFSTGYAGRLPVLADNEAKEHVNGTVDDLYSGKYYYLATLRPYFSTAWEAPCFKKNFAYLTFSKNRNKAYLVIEVEDAESWICTDYYEFRVDNKTIATESIFFSKDPHEVVIDTGNVRFRKKIVEHGVAVYLYDKSPRDQWKEISVQPLPNSTADLAELMKMIEEDKNKSAGCSDNGVYKHGKRIEMVTVK